MTGKILLRGVLAGAVGGLLAFVFARIFAEPVISRATNYEAGRRAAQNLLDKAAGRPVYQGEPDVFSRTLQANLGAGVGLILFGAAMGTLFAVVFAVCLGRAGKLRPRTLALLVALGGFLGMYLLPFLIYPANPPAIGHEDTIAERSGFYLLMVFPSVVLLALAVALGRKLQARFGNWNATLIAGAGFVLAIGIVMALLPKIGMLATNVREYGAHGTETPLPLTDPKGNIVFPGFPADDLYQFRLYSVGAQLILWAAIALVFAPLAERLFRTAGRSSSGREHAPV